MLVLVEAAFETQEFLRKLGDFGRHRRREEQCLAGEGDHLADALDVGDETHVEHAVRLVDDEDLDAVEQKLAAFAVVEQPAGRGDQNVGAALELFFLLVEGDATNQQGDIELVVLAVADEVFLDLRGEFARRFKDQRAWHARAGTTLFETRDHRQNECRSLARTRLGDAEHVLSLQGMRNGPGLDRRRHRVARVGYGGKDLRRKAEVCEFQRFWSGRGVGQLAGCFFGWIGAALEGAAASASRLRYCALRYVQPHEMST